MLIDLAEEDVRWIRDTLVHIASGAPLKPPNKDGVLDRLNEAIKKSITVELEGKVRADFKKVKGRALLLGVGATCAGFKHGSHDSSDCELRTPAITRIDDTVDESDLINWIDCGNHAWIDPHWNATLVEGHDQLSHYRSFWVIGRSYNTDPDGDHAKPVSYELLSDILADRDALI